jgi:hypothetical protein
MSTPLLPPPALRERIPEIAKAAAEVENLRARATKARQDLIELEHARDRAVKADAQTSADAIRAKKSQPSPTTPKATAAIEKAKPSLAALQIAVADAEDDMRKAIQEHGDDLQARLTEEADAQRVECQALAAKLAEKVDARQQTLALRGWLSEPERQYRPGAFSGMRASSLGPKPNGEEFHVGEIVAALIEAFAPPKPSAPKPKTQPLERPPVFH